jgi:hypothetical protein
MHVTLGLRRLAFLVPAAAGLLTLAACGGSGNTAPAADKAAPPAAAPAAPTAGAEPVAPMSSRGTPVAEGAGAGAAASASITWDLPSSWQQEQPGSEMRMAQATIPGAAGPGQLVVFYFGAGGGGGVEANLDRWIGQMEVKVGGEPQRSTFDVHGYKVTMLDVAGTLKPSGMGMGPSSPQPDSRMLAAVVEGPGGPWFFKATGPDATLSAAHDDFKAMLESVRPHG